jgi:hypothetical protein
VQQNAEGFLKMKASKGGLLKQIKAFRARFAQSGEAMLGEVISRERLLEYVAAEVGKYRESKFNPLQTVLMFLEQVLSADHSCNDAVSRERNAQVMRGEKGCSANNGSYCAARIRLPLGLLVRLGKEVGAQLIEKQPLAWLWRGRPLKLVDGVVVSMPDTPENQASYPQNRQQKAGLGFPVARIVALVSLSCGAVLDWAIEACEGKQTGETALLWTLAKHLKRRDVLIADRCYSGYFMIAWLMQHGVDVVIRQHQRRHTDFRRGRRLGQQDHVVDWLRPQRPSWMTQDLYETMPETLAMREIRVADWTVVSRFINPREVSKAELHKLYQLRWHVELDIRSIKDLMQMDVLRCKSPEMVRKEIAAHFAAYNLVRAVMAQAAERHSISPRGLSFSGALQELRAFGTALSACTPTIFLDRCTTLLAGIAQRKLPDRPGRVEPRAVKRRPKPQALLTSPRNVMRKKLQRMRERYEEACHKCL